jgi:hypothetical protein
MRLWAVACAISLLFAASHAGAKLPGQADDFRQLSKVDSLPVALDRDFVFRKTKLFSLGTPGPKGVRFVPQGASRNPAINAENSYRLFGAVTELDKRRRYGNYLDFFWRGRRAVPLTVRLEYRQEGLRAFTQAREVSYANAKGSHKTAFAIIGDDYLNDGRLTAWRCLLIVDGRIVAENRSYLWQ